MGGAGVDGQTIKAVEEIGVDDILQEIQQELREGKYYPKPVKRVEIPKGNKGKRPLGIPTVRHRKIQAAAKIVIEPIFEADFRGCSYGFRPKRNAHQALTIIRETIQEKKCNLILDADIKSYFSNINHDKLMKLVEMRICDRRVLKLIRKWLKAGVMIEGQYHESDIGSPQGNVISPLLANIYLNYMIYNGKGMANPWERWLGTVTTW
jgi:RNA-directed DNA polymerase